jgi:hypothetical protein
MTTQWLNGILGLWVIISPFIGFTPGGMTANLVIVGIAVALLGFGGAAYEQNYRRAHGIQHRHMGA